LPGVSPERRWLPDGESPLTLTSETYVYAGRVREPGPAIIFDPPLVPRLVDQRGARCFAACLASLLDLDLDDLPDDLDPCDGCVLKPAHEWVAVFGLGLLVRELRPPRLVERCEAVAGAPSVILVRSPAGPGRAPEAAVGQIQRGRLLAVHDPTLAGATAFSGSGRVEFVVALVSRWRTREEIECPFCC
jgi:hypothetical protein